MSNKTISINPSLFTLNSSKTKKKREKKLTPNNPIISPNVLKNKLLKRIKEHKHRETLNLENNKKKLSNETNETNEFDSKFETNDLNKFSDEFNESINYLQTLSKQKKINDEKTNYEKQKQKRKEELEKKTLKNYEIINNNYNPYVNLELPEELQITTEQFISTEPKFSIKSSNSDPIPYGVLKGGNKPTYRDWSKTQRNNIITNPNSALIIEGFQASKIKNERENRLNNLREKLKLKDIENSKISTPLQSSAIENSNENIMMTKNLIQKPILNNLPINESSLLKNSTSLINNNYNSNNNSNYNNNNNNNNNKLNFSTKPEDREKTIAIKKIIKKTIKRKYTLGKSKIEKKVGVLIKDRGTRKKILSAQKELKSKPINDIKSYLRDHNLIKVGSNAPNDVIRKLYESAMLAGEITNSNSETLLFNYSKQENKM